MPIKIYWGPPGSYKSAAAVWDDVVECAKQGRVLITNVRGLTEERCAKHLSEVKSGFRVLHFRMDKQADLGVLRRWWHWAPFGAYFLLDEVQAIYPPFWTAKELRALDGPADKTRRFPSGEDMPKEMELAFDMHRHGNWDFTFTTPNIKKVRQEIRAAAEWAYKHRNLAFTVIFRGSFMEFQHSAEDNGNPSDIFMARRRKVPGYVFDLYDSTATGKAKDSSAGGSMWTSPYLLLLAASIVGLLGWLSTRELPAPLKAAAAAEEAAKASAGAPAVRSGSQGVQRPVGGVERGPFHIPEPPPVEKKEKPVSSTWRLLGVLESRGHPGVALLANGAARRRIDATECQMVGGYDEWECLVDGQRVTRWSGADPLGQALGILKLSTP